MSISLPALPYAMDALSPYISEETLKFHYEKHHRAYVNQLNALIAHTPFEAHSLEDIVRHSDGPIFNNAAQVWNHTFYWNGLTPYTQKKTPNTHLAQKLQNSFGDIDLFKEQFLTAAARHFGSGWTWLVLNTQGQLEIVSTENAKNPLTQGKIPILTCDVWEHAYYIDTRNDRASYLKNFWELIHWDLVNERLELGLKDLSVGII